MLPAVAWPTQTSVRADGNRAWRLPAGYDFRMEQFQNVAFDVPGAREPPLYFAGRADELGALRRRLARICRTGDASNGLQLVTGVPGAGKSQLAREFANRVDGETINGRQVCTLIIAAEDLDHPVDLFLAMSRALGASELGAEVAGHEDKLSNVSVRMGGVGGGVARDVGRHTAGFGGLLRQSHAAGMWGSKALVLMVDELQGVKPSGMDALKTLHTGLSQCPIHLAGFGLQHTRARLARPATGDGISRVAETMSLRPLSEDDTADAFRGSFEALGVAAVVPPKAAKALADASYGFPQHINGYLEGAALAISKHGRLNGPALDDALLHGDKRRIDYYKACLSNARSHMPMIAVVAEMERTGDKTIKYEEARDALEQSGYGEAELEAAVQHGSLTLDADNGLSFGIPSFHSYMTLLLANERARERQRANEGPGLGR